MAILCRPATAGVFVSPALTTEDGTAYGRQRNSKSTRHVKVIMIMPWCLQ